MGEKWFEFQELLEKKTESKKFLDSVTVFSYPEQREKSSFPSVRPLAGDVCEKLTFRVAKGN